MPHHTAPAVLSGVRVHLVRPAAAGTFWEALAFPDVVSVD